jgi:serine phosphatase RsbU (regulator of sigma subunit)
MYTDGVTEAQNAQEAFFEEDRLRDIVLANRTGTAVDIRDCVIADVDAFVGDATQFDDITMMVVTRDSVP